MYAETLHVAGVVGHIMWAVHQAKGHLYCLIHREADVLQSKHMGSVPDKNVGGPNQPVRIEEAKACE